MKLIGVVCPLVSLTEKIKEVFRQATIAATMDLKMLAFSNAAVMYLGQF